MPKSPSFQKSYTPTALYHYHATNANVPLLRREAAGQGHWGITVGGEGEDVRAVLWARHQLGGSHHQHQECSDAETLREQWTRNRPNTNNLALLSVPSNVREILCI